MYKKLLFMLHIRNSYPTTIRTKEGIEIPANIIRARAGSSLVRPDVKKDPFKHGLVVNDSTRMDGRINIYTPRKDHNG